jgi:hypothetical protein
MTESAAPEEVRTRLRSVLATADEVEGYLQAAVGLVGGLVEVEGSFTLSTVVYDNPVTVATTDREGWEADQVEFDVVDGPCVEVLLQGAALKGIDLTSERRWPAWSAVAELLGFRSATAVGAELESGQRIVLNGYSLDDALLDPATVDRAQQFVLELAFTIPLALRLAQQSGAITDLQQALASRSTIDQALGVLMAQNRCTSEEAFGILRRASQNRNIKLRDVAAAVINRYTGHPADPPPAFRPAKP